MLPLPALLLRKAQYAATASNVDGVTFIDVSNARLVWETTVNYSSLDENGFEALRLLTNPSWWHTDLQKSSNHLKYRFRRLAQQPILNVFTSARTVSSFDIELQALDDLLLGGWYTGQLATALATALAPVPTKLACFIAMYDD